MPSRFAGIPGVVRDFRPLRVRDVRGMKYENVA
jgi:hypothetical protein